MAGKIALSWASSATGEFQRQASSFRNIIPSAQFPAEKDRYHLYVSYACPWAHRTLIVRALKGLDHVFGVSVVNWLLDENGWSFHTDGCPGATVDHCENKEFLKELYFQSNPEYTGRFTVPVLWDKKLRTIVNNESSEIIRMFNSAFNEFATNPGLDLYPVNLRAEIDTLNAWIYDGFNNGVYKSGFATQQKPYEDNCKTVFESMDKIEALLKNRPFIAGDVLTEADVRLFTTAVRFDPVYHGHFKCNIRTLEHGYANFLKWTRKMYQYGNGLVSDTVNLQHIKAHYYLSHVKINPTGIIPLGTGPDLTVKV